MVQGKFGTPFKVTNSHELMLAFYVNVFPFNETQ